MGCTHRSPAARSAASGKSPSFRPEDNVVAVSLRGEQYFGSADPHARRRGWPQYANRARPAVHQQYVHVLTRTAWPGIPTGPLQLPRIVTREGFNKLAGHRVRRFAPLTPTLPMGTRSWRTVRSACHEASRIRAARGRRWQRSAKARATGEGHARSTTAGRGGHTTPLIHFYPCKDRKIRCLPAGHALPSLPKSGGMRRQQSG